MKVTLVYEGRHSMNTGTEWITQVLEGDDVGYSYENGGQNRVGENVTPHCLRIWANKAESRVTFVVPFERLVSVFCEK